MRKLHLFTNLLKLLTVTLYIYSGGQKFPANSIFFYYSYKKSSKEINKFF